MTADIISGQKSIMTEDVYLQLKDKFMRDVREKTTEKKMPDFLSRLESNAST